MFRLFRNSTILLLQKILFIIMEGFENDGTVGTHGTSRHEKFSGIVKSFQ